jgi:DNA-binding CsgD family transcriptional regulator
LRCEALGYGSPLPAAVVLFSDPNDRSPIQERSLMQAYRLTKAEARLLGALLEGQSPSEYADAAGLSINTVKTQMRHVFGKTGYNRHADLIRAVVGNPVFRVDEGQRGD